MLEKSGIFGDVVVVVIVIVVVGEAEAGLEKRWVWLRTRSSSVTLARRAALASLGRVVCELISERNSAYGVCLQVKVGLGLWS